MTRPRRFAPLDPKKRLDGDTRPTLEGIVFDVDGTLCESHSIPCYLVVGVFTVSPRTSSSSLSPIHEDLLQQHHSIHQTSASGSLIQITFHNMLP